MMGRGDPSWHKQFDQPKDTVVYYDPKYHQNGHCEPRKDHQYQDTQCNAGYTNYDSSYEHEKVNVPFGHRPQYGYGYDYNTHHM
uniref:Uncharacterized protein n=1 Tax=Plectus sambesii TaxID=2011161 RepID=A0A914VT35_9BILA